MNPPTITPRYPVDGALGIPRPSPLYIRIADDVGVVESSIWVLVDGVYYVGYGGALAGAQLELSANDENGFDLELTLPTAKPEDTTVSVSVQASSPGGHSTRNFVYRTAMDPRLLSVENPRDGLLLARFNVAMLQDPILLATGSWKLLPSSSSSIGLIVVGVTVDPTRPEVVNLAYEGGSQAEYTLAAGKLFAADGGELLPANSSQAFDLVYPAPSEAQVHLFDTIWGPLGIAQNLSNRRGIDQLVRNRAISSALNEQIAQRLSANNGTAGRDGRPGGNRS